MSASYTNFSQSPYFNAAFNAAIFDGPLRTYFSQLHEAFALKIYFSISQQCISELDKCKQIHRDSGKTLMVLLYPTAEAFRISFEVDASFITLAEVEGDDIIGITAPFEDKLLTEIVNSSKGLMSFWEPVQKHSEPLNEIGLP